MMVLSILYGATVAILAILGVDNFWVFAAIGAIVLGALWAMTGVFTKKYK